MICRAGFIEFFVSAFVLEHFHCIMSRRQNQPDATAKNSLDRFIRIK